MRFNRGLSILGLSILGLNMLSPVIAQASEKDAAESLKFFRDLAETRNYTLGNPVSTQPTPDGKSVLFLRGGPRDPVLRLYELDVKSAQVTELLTPEAILKGVEEQLSVEERARRERQRMSLRGFTGFEMSRDGAQILLTLSGHLYVVRRADKHITELPGIGWIDPHFSPDGKAVAAVRENEVYRIDIASAKEQQLTRGASQTLTHGVAEFVAQEEMDRFRGYWWSPDSAHIAYQETDLSPVQKLFIADPANPLQPPEGFYYPRAGTPNAKVRLGIMPQAGGVTTWVTWDAERYPYLARVVWMEGGPLTILVQTRDQREEKLLAVDDKTGTTTELLTEKDAAWVNLDRDHMPWWLSDGSGFLWRTERRGEWQLELRGPRGELVRELTPVDFRCTGVSDVDVKGRTLVVSGGTDSRESQLYRVSLTGGQPMKLTAGAGFHDAKFSRNSAIYVYHAALLDGSDLNQVRRAKDGKVLATMPSEAEKPPFVPRLEVTAIKAAGSPERSFDAALVRPRDFKPGQKYPVLVNVYAGPTVKTVNTIAKSYLRSQWMADQGYIVVTLDGRGTPGHGHDWERAVKGNLIDIALEDQVAGLKALGEKYPELDLERVGVNGWSFGGYFTAMATIRRPDVYKVGVSGAPVTDWADYDTHYTERYMDLPETNLEGYKKSSVMTYAGELKRPLMLVHGLTDDNVYFVHTFKLADALFKAGKPFELLPLTGTHMAMADPMVGMRLWTLTMGYFDQYLKP